MQCISCGTAISTKMKSAIGANACPYCGSAIMEPKKAQQYSQLVNVLDRTRLTNRDDIDAQVKDKLIDVLTKNFEFTKIEGVKEEDVIVVDAPASVEAPATPTDVPVRTAQAAARKRPKRSAGSIYEQAQQDTYGDGEETDEPDLSKYDDVSAEEAAMWFQDTTPDAIAERVEMLKGKLGKTTASSDSGSSIRRLK